MNEKQKKIVAYGLYALSAALVLIFWRFGSQSDYNDSMLVFATREVPGLDWVYGLRIRMGITGVIFGIIIPIAMTSLGLFISNSDKK